MQDGPPLRTAEHAIGVLCLALAVLFVLPVPLANVRPALTIRLLSFAVLERAGPWAIAGNAVGPLSPVLVAGVVYALAEAALFILANAFT